MTHSNHRRLMLFKTKIVPEEAPGEDSQRLVCSLSDVHISALENL